MISLRTVGFPALGRVVLAETPRGVAAISLAPVDSVRADLARRHPGVSFQEDPTACAAAVLQLEEYLAGERTVFDFAVDPSGTPFQREVWAALDAIPYGATSTYAAVAQQIGRPTAVRAVGAAVGANPLCIVVPCHRVVGSNGKLTGYAYGLSLKERLLTLESGR